MSPSATSHASRWGRALHSGALRVGARRRRSLCQRSESLKPPTHQPFLLPDFGEVLRDLGEYFKRADLGGDVLGINASVDLLRRTRGGDWPSDVSINAIPYLQVPMM